MNDITTSSKTEQQIADLEKEIQSRKKELAKLRKSVKPTPVDDYTFHYLDGSEVKLSELFGDNEELLLIFNMGKSCPYCTLWADGYNGFTDHLENRAAFVVLSPDAPEVAKEFAESRNWRFNLVSDYGSNFREDFGFRTEEYILPAATALTKSDDGILMHSKTQFGPGDNYCSIWDFMDLMPKGYNNWSPKYNY